MELARRLINSRTFNALLVAPIITFGGLGGHMLYRYYVQTPDPIKLEVGLSCQ